MRQGALYGALEALQAASVAVKESDDPAPNVRFGKDVKGAHIAKGAGANLTPEEVWQSIPSGGEVAWKASNPRQQQRLRVARLQEALSEAATGLQKATEACRGGGEEDPYSLGAASLGAPGPAASLRNECVILEAESKELEEEKEFLDARMAEVKEELARMKEAFPGSTRSTKTMRASIAEEDGKKATPESVATPESPAKSLPTAGDVNELAVVLRLLACLKDLALNNRSVVLPPDPSRWTREQQVVAYFLDEVEACQSRIAGAY